MLVRQAISLCEGAKTRVSVDSELPEEPKVAAGMHQGSMTSPLYVAVVIGVITEFDGVR